MRTLLAFGVFVLILDISSAQVLELNDANFLEAVTGHPLVLVEFYSPTCPFCQKLAPVYEQAANRLHDSQPSVQVAKVDCTNDASNVTCTKSSVRYVPWIVLFQNGAQIKSFGDRKRDEETIVNFVTDVFNNKTTPEKQQDVTVPKVPPINACDERPPKSVAAPTTITEGLPVTELTDATFADFMKSSPYVLVDYYAPWCSDCQRLSPLFDEAALQLQKTNPKIKFAKVDCNQGNLPTFAICKAVKLQFFPWVVLYHNGQAVSHYDKENIPDTATIYNFINSGTKSNDNSSQVVKELDDTNFDSVVNSHPYVLVNFYAPWCFYCKKMTPFYEEVATEIKTSEPTVRLVKVDCTATNTNTKATCTKNDIAFLPTLKLFQNGKFFKEYEGDKTRKGPILSFITDSVDSQQSSKRHLNSNSNNKTENHEKNDKTSKYENKNSKDQSEEGSSGDKELEDKDQEDDEKDLKKKKHEEEEKDLKKKKKKKTSKDAPKKHKIVAKTTRKESSRVDRAARILKKVFTQFKNDKLSKKRKHRKYNDDDDEEGSDNNQWQQVVKDIHQISKDIHKMSKEFHKSISNKQPAVDRLVKVFSHLVKTKDEDEDDF